MGRLRESVKIEAIKKEVKSLEDYILHDDNIGRGTRIRLEKLIGNIKYQL